MKFARTVWHVLVAIKDGLVLVLLLLFFLGLSAALTARGSSAKVKDGALLVKLDGRVVEEPSEGDPLGAALSGEAPDHEFRARDVARAIRGAATDPKIKAVALDLSKFAGGGLVNLEEVGAAMDAVRAAKKPVLAFGDFMEDGGVLLASHASDVWVDPMGGAVVTGPGGQHLYYASLLQKLKITAHVYKVGTYKDYVEPYVRDGQSEPAKEARQALYAAYFGEWKSNVAKARPKADIARVTSDPIGWLKASNGDVAKASLAAGLVDHLGTRADWGAAVARLAGADDDDDHTPGGFAHTSLKTWLAANPLPKSGKPIGVVTIAGDIVEGGAGPGTAGGDRIARLIDASAKQDIAALVVRVDSPGGSVTASEKIRQALVRAKARGLPVAVSMANMAASGGYWVSTPGQRIFAEPGTITGSIGIFAVIPSFEKLLDSWGAHSDGVRTTPLSGQPDPIAGLTPEVEAMLQMNVEEGYRRFLGVVGESRHKTPEQVDAIGQGRVWDGGTARQNGLVDQFGGLDEALAWAARQAKLPADGWYPLYLKKKPSGFHRLVAMLGRHDDDDDDDSASDDGAVLDWAGRAAQQQRAVFARALADAGRVVAGQGVQAYCLDCLYEGAPPPPVKAPAGGFAEVLARIEALL